MEFQSSIEISKKLKTELNRRIISKSKDYDAFIWSLLHLLDAYMDMFLNHPKQMEGLRKAAQTKRRAFLRKEEKRKKHRRIR
jgi:hypothetical protein